MVLTGRRVVRSRYRPDPWRTAEWGVAATGVVVAAVVVAAGAGDPTALHPSLTPLTWPPLPLLPAAAVVVGALPAWIAPAPPHPQARIRPPRRSGPAPVDVDRSLISSGGGPASASPPSLGAPVVPEASR